MVLTGPADPVRALIIGTGSIGRRHIDNLRLLRPQAQFAFLRSGGREDENSRALGAKVHSSIDRALAWKPDLAVIASPSDRHFEVLQPLLSAGIATLIEKPVVIDARHADLLEALDPASLPPTQVGCVLRFLPAVEVLQQWIATGRLGKVMRARLECGQYLPDWRPTDYRSTYSAHARCGGGVIFDLIHELDLAEMLFGKCRLEHAFAAKRSALEIDSEDVALLVLSAADGLPISIGLDYVSRTPIRFVEVVGEAASARLDFVARELTLTAPGAPIEVITEGFDLAAAYRTELGELLDAAAGGAAPRLPMHEGLSAIRLALAAHACAGRRAGTPA